MENSEDRSIDILYADEDVSFRELVSAGLPYYGDFTVSTAATPLTAADTLLRDQIDCLILADSFPETFKQELHDVLNEQGTTIPVRIKKNTNTGEATIPTSSAMDEDFQETSPEQFSELLTQIGNLVGKPCTGYLLLPESGRDTTLNTSIEWYDDIKLGTGISSDKYHPQTLYERPLVALHEATSELMQAETTDEILTIALDTIQNILQLPAVAIYLWDEQAGVLQPYKATDTTKTLLGELPTFTGPDSLAWDTFIDGEFRVYDDVRHHRNRYNSETVIETELFAPLGEHGLLISGTSESEVFSTIERKVAQTLAVNIATALDLVDQKQQLTQQQQQLQQQQERLTTLERINSVIRKIGQATVTASSQSEIEQTLCEQLTAIDPFCFAWIGQYEHDSELHARQWSGTNGEFLDHLYGATEESSEPIPPAEQALCTEEVHVTQNIFSDDSFAPWRKAALNRGFQSAISLPLSYQQTTYGVLEIYASEPNAFESEERDAFGELGEMIANAYSAIERKQALVSDTQTELELRMSDQDDLFSRTVRETNVELELDTVVSRDDGTWLLYLITADVDSSAVLSVLRDFTIVESAQQIRGREDTNLFGVIFTEFELGELLSTHGAQLKTLEASPAETTLEVSVPEEADVRSVVSTCQNRYPDIELVRRTSDVDNSTSDSGAQLLEPLTDKQHEAIEVALKQGFFAWPRDKTGEEIAESLGITAPTFHRHVRMGLEALVQETMGQ